MGLIKLLKKSLKKLKKAYRRYVKKIERKLHKDQVKAIKKLYAPKARAPKKVDAYLNGKMVKLAMKKEMARIKKAMKDLTEDGTGWRG